MIKIILLLSLFIGYPALAASNWQTVIEGENYKLKKPLDIKSNGKVLQIKRGTSLKLVKTTTLNMIKVSHQKYQIKNCKNTKLETEVELIPVSQKNKEIVSVGVNLVKGCFLEIFVENKDIKANNFFI
jgi:hypothetical protein